MLRRFALLAAFATMGVLAQDSSVIGRRALDYLLAERFPELSAMFNNAMKEILTLDVLRGRVHSELAGFGKPGNIGDPVIARDAKSGVTLVSFPVAFSQAKVNVQFNIEDSGKLAAIHFRPADAPLPASWQHPSYAKADSFTAREVTVGSDPWKLGATLTVPVGKGPFPAFVLVHGPGPNDRDESIRANKVFADIAEGLSSRGIVVLRYDKRTLAHGREMSEIPFTLKEETTDDALAAVALMRMQPEADRARIYVLGHSLGGYAAPRIAKADGKLAGIIFLAANSRPVQELLLDQTEYLSAAGVLPDDEAKKRLDLLKAETEKLQALRPGEANPPVVMGLPSAWLLDVKNYDPASDAAKLTIPMLFLQGERDFQIGIKDFTRWKSALNGHANATFQSYADLNHLFMSGKGRSLPAEYATPSNVSEAVIADIAKWIATAKH